MATYDEIMARLDRRPGEVTRAHLRRLLDFAREEELHDAVAEVIRRLENAALNGIFDLKGVLQTKIDETFYPGIPTGEPAQPGPTAEEVEIIDAMLQDTLVKDEPARTAPAPKRPPALPPIRPTPPAARRTIDGSHRNRTGHVDGAASAHAGDGRYNEGDGVVPGRAPPPASRQPVVSGRGGAVHGPGRGALPQPPRVLPAAGPRPQARKSSLGALKAPGAAQEDAAPQPPEVPDQAVEVRARTPYMPRPDGRNMRQYPGGAVRTADTHRFGEADNEDE